MRIVDKFKIQTYNVGFIARPIEEILKNGISKGDIIWMKHKYKDRFFADPFLWYRDDQYYYIVCEEMTFWEQKGVISLLTVRKDNYKLVEKKTIIEEPTHLSFPFCEENGTEIVPESVLSGKSKKYYFNKNHEIIKKEIIFDEGLIDTVFFTDQNDIEWMFTAKNKIPSSELYLYKKNSIGKYDGVIGNPVEVNNRTTRSAGRLFRSNGKLYRPVQDCLGRYGRQTKILEIDNISDEGIKCKEITTLNSYFNPPYNETFHTFNVYDGIIVVDGSRDFIRFPMKIFYRKFPCLFRRK